MLWRDGIFYVYYKTFILFITLCIYQTFQQVISDSDQFTWYNIKLKIFELTNMQVIFLRYKKIYIFGSFISFTNCGIILYATILLDLCGCDL